MAPDRDEGDRPFLQRWSRRKREREAEDRDATPAAEPAPPVPTAANEQEAEEYRQQLEKNREAAEAIDLATLNARSDLSPFFKNGVPKALKKAAMRSLWRSDKVFANLDGLNDYDENFADPELVRKFSGTAWKIGKGYLFNDPAIVEETASIETETVESLDESLHEPDPGIESSEAGTADTVKENSDPAPETPGKQDNPQISERPTEEPEKVPLRERLALDGWHGKKSG